MHAHLYTERSHSPSYDVPHRMMSTFSLVEWRNGPFWTMAIPPWWGHSIGDEQKVQVVYHGIYLYIGRRTIDVVFWLDFSPVTVSACTSLPLRDGAHEHRSNAIHAFCQEQGEGLLLNECFHIRCWKIVRMFASWQYFQYYVICNTLCCTE